MCGGDDHLAWKRPVSSEACRGLRTAGGYDHFCWGYFKVHPYPFRATLTLVEGRLVRVSDTPDMDQQVVTVDQFTAAMASIQEALASLRQEISGQQVHQASPYVLHGHSEIAPPAVAQALSLMTRMRAWTASSSGCQILRGTLVIGCPRLHLRLYSTVMRAHGLDEPQMITLFPLSLSGAAQRWFASLESSRRRTWDDLAQEFLRQFSFNTVVDVSRRELEALRQRTEESVSSSFPAGAGR
ncbi:hypothetical protein CK203_011531 [Vitis vinifera]|uniref:Retrotransposon gag domain-containing protein n=1 Tax=Vitis vinifera TaxID=29760 RepID=A0A438JUK7_VITVI|nr:hypothetical protein CK203_011531 [Vitis vinifera]